jgi:hypothetical protein
VPSNGIRRAWRMLSPWKGRRYQEDTVAAGSQRGGTVTLMHPMIPQYHRAYVRYPPDRLRQNGGTDPSASPI